jgi:uncharacterized membrane protein
MTTFLKEAGIEVEPIHVALWGIPTAICAFVIHAWRLHRLDRTLARELATYKAGVEASAANASAASTAAKGA